MEEKSLRITGADTGFFNKITSTLTRILTPTKIGINSMLISIRRNSLIKAFIRYKDFEEDYDDRKELENRYLTTYENYLDALDKYVMDSIYKKVKNNTASEFEKNSLAKYYEVVSLKENEYVEYKNRKQKYLIDLDYEGVKLSKKSKLIQNYSEFYADKMDTIYKAILKNYSIKLADTTSVYDSTKDWIYTKIFLTLDDYAGNILPLKLHEEVKTQKVFTEYERYEKFTVGKLDTRDNIEKNMVLLGLSRFLFTHSLPLVVAEQCYEKLLKDARMLVQDTKIATKREKAYSTLINLMEDYNVKLLSKKVYWDKPKQREEYKKFWNKYKEIKSKEKQDFAEYIKEKEILFIKHDLNEIAKDKKLDYSKIEKYYKRKLIDYGAMRIIKDKCKSEGNYIKIKEVA